MGMPLIGPDRQAYKLFRKQISERPSSYIDAWSDNAYIIPLRNELAACIVKPMDWPCDKFLPNDPCDIIFFDDYLEFSSGCCLVDIEKKYKLCIPVGELSKWTFLEFITHIHHNMKLKNS